MPSRIVCDGRPRRLGGGREGEVEAWERELVGVRGESSVAGQVEQEEGGGEASEEEGGASGEAEGARGEQGQEMDEDGEPDGELDGVLGVAEQAREMEVALEPAQEELDLPAPEVDLDDLGGGEVPAIGEDLVAAGDGRAVAGAEARGDVGGDQAPAGQDDAGTCGGGAEGDSLGGDDGDPAAVDIRQRRLDRAVDLDGDDGAGVAPGHDVDAGREQ